MTDPTAPPYQPCLYAGHVMHHRLRPVDHRFVYRTVYLLLDIDRLEELDRRHRLLSVDRPNLFAFSTRDHGPRNGSPLRPWVVQQLRRHGLGEADGAIRLLCLPRFLGYVFNPLSVYYCYDREGRLRALVHEVKNTFGEQHPYVLPVEEDGAGSAIIRQSCAKDFYVSPFIEMAARYHFRLSPPGERIAVAIREQVDGATALVATLSGKRRPLSDRALAMAALRHPFLTQKVIAGIHWEALRIWLKGAPLQPRPAAGGSGAPRVACEPVEHP